MAFNTQSMLLLGLALVFAGVFIFLAANALPRKGRPAQPTKWLWLSGGAFLLAYLAWIFLRK